MAKLDFYRQQTTPRGLGPGPVLRVPDVRSSWGETAALASRVATQLGDVINKQVEDSAAIDASARVMAAHRRWVEREQEMRTQAQEAGDLDGFTGRLTQEYEQFTAEELKQARTPASRQWMTERMGQLGLTLFERSMQWEAGAKVERDVGLATQALDDARAVVDADPTQFAAARETLQLPFARLPADKRAEAWREAESRLALSAGIRGADAAPRSVLQALDAKPGESGIDWVNALDADDRVRVRAAAEGRMRELEAEARARAAEAREELRIRLENQTAQIEAGIIPENPISRGEFAAAGLSEEFGGYQELLRQGSDYQALYALPEADIRALVEGRTPAGEEDFARRFQMNQRLRARAADVIEAREADPGRYLYQYSPTVAAAYNAIETARTPQESAAASRRYAQVATAEARRLGIRNPNILPQVYADSVVARFDQQEQGGESAALLIQGEREKWGPYWPQVMRQIGPKLPGAAAVIGTGMRPQPAARLAELSRLKDDEVAKLLPAGTPQSDVRNAVREELTEFAATVQGQPNDANTLGMLTDAAYRLAVSHVAAGRDVSEAATMAAAEVVNERYQFTEVRDSPIRVPVGVPTAEVRWGLRSIWYREIRALGYPRLDEARWQTLPNDGGVALVFQGAVVTRKDGTPVRYTWQELRNAAATQGEDARQIDRDLRDPARDRLP